MMTRHHVVVRALLLAVACHPLTSAAELPQALSQIRAAIEVRRSKANALAVKGVTTMVRKADRESSEELSVPATSEVPFRWVLQPGASRFRLDEVTRQRDPTSGTDFALETVMAFDGRNGVLWHPKHRTMDDGNPVIDASRMSADNDFLKARIYGPVFWWLGILDDYNALITARPSNLDACEWSQSPDQSELIATLRNGEREKEFVFSITHDHNIIRATDRLHRRGQVMVTSNTTVTYRQQADFWIPVSFIREISSGVDSTDFTSWDLIPELPLEDTQLPKDFLKPGMLVSDDRAGYLQSVSHQNTLIPHGSGTSIPAASSSRRLVFLSVVTLAVLVLILVRAMRSGHS